MKSYRPHALLLRYIPFSIGHRSQTLPISLINIIALDLFLCLPLSLSVVQMASLGLVCICLLCRYVFCVLIQGGQGRAERRRFPVVHFLAFLHVAFRHLCFHQRATLVAQLIKTPTCNVGDLGLIPGLGRSPGEGKDYSTLVF